MNAILLAAGLSKRMGVQKLLLPFGESTVIETVIKNMHEGGFSSIIAVFSEEVYEAIQKRPEWLHIGINRTPERGQSSSLAIALDMLPENEDFCIMLGDLPFVGQKEIKKLRECYAALPDDKTVFTPCRNGVFGHPMFYRSIWKKRFSIAQGDIGGRNILMDHKDEIVTSEAPDCHFRDIDTPDDYRNFVKNS
ncbi:MAG: nucleotidyltransferase family protein [Synergistaceae bacterium]|nr:nucleotidyltransferase family protein [Synergistaceae bacterium]